jgi:hypothetical protein
MLRGLILLVKFKEMKNSVIAFSVASVLVASLTVFVFKTSFVVALAATSTSATSTDAEPAIGLADTANSTPSVSASSSRRRPQPRPRPSLTTPRRPMRRLLLHLQIRRRHMATESPRLSACTSLAQSTSISSPTAPRYSASPAILSSTPT